MTAEQPQVPTLTEEGVQTIFNFLYTVLGYVANSKPHARSGMVFNEKTGHIRPYGDVVIDEVRAVAALFGWTVRDPEPQPEKPAKKRRKA